MRRLTRGFASVSFAQFGAPSTVLKSGVAAASASPSSGKVAVKITACHVTGEDIRAVRGLSLLRTSVGVAGSTGVGAVSTVGAGVTHLSTNDKVLVVSPTGVWTDNVTVPSSAVAKIPSSLADDDMAALPALVSAYAILTQYVTLKAGDVVVQTDADLPVGTAIAQTGKALGVTVMAASKADLEDARYAENLKGKPVKLAICGTASKVATRSLSRCLASEGTMIVYQAHVADAQEGMDVPVSAAIFNKTSMCGFNLQAFATTNPTAFQKAVDAVSDMLTSKKVSVTKAQSFPQADFLAAIAAAETGKATVLKI